MQAKCSTGRLHALTVTFLRLSQLSGVWTVTTCNSRQIMLAQGWEKATHASQQAREQKRAEWMLVLGFPFWLHLLIFVFAVWNYVWPRVVWRRVSETSAAYDKILCATSQIVRKCLMPHTQHQTDQTVRLSPKQTQTPSWQTRQNPDRFCPAALMLFWQSSWARLVTAASSASDSISLKSWQCQKDPTHGPARAQEQRKHSDNRAVPARSRRAVITSCSKPSFRDAAMHVPASQ